MTEASFTVQVAPPEGGAQPESVKAIIRSGVSLETVYAGLLDVDITVSGTHSTFSATVDASLWPSGEYQLLVWATRDGVSHLVAAHALHLQGGCSPACAGRQCGSDGCSGACGQCPVDSECHDGQCGPISAEPAAAELTWPTAGAVLSLDTFEVVAEIRPGSAPLTALTLHAVGPWGLQHIAHRPLPATGPGQTASRSFTVPAADWPSGVYALYLWGGGEAGLAPLATTHVYLGASGPQVGHALTPFISQPAAGAQLESPQFEVHAHAPAGAPALTAELRVLGHGHVIHEDSRTLDATAPPLVASALFSVDAQGWTNGHYTIVVWMVTQSGSAASAQVSFHYRGLCEPHCTGKGCGPDGCSGQCGLCPEGAYCNVEYQCAAMDPESDMVPVPAGLFWMGCNDFIDNSCYADESPGRDVWLDAFEIDRVPVTAGRFASCVDAQACEWSGPTPQIVGFALATQCTFGHSGRLHHPMNCMTRSEARAFCEWDGKRLCTEAEWEKAARGTDGRLFPWGSTKASCALAVVSPPCPGESPHTHPVGGKPAGASPYGALDMVGNVITFLEDWYAEDYYSYAPNVQPTGPPEEAATPFSRWNPPWIPLVSARGVHYDSTEARQRRVSNREGARAFLATPWTGVRCCRSLP